MILLAETASIDGAFVIFATSGGRFSTLQRALQAIIAPCKGGSNWSRFFARVKNADTILPGDGMRLLGSSCLSVQAKTSTSGLDK